MFDTNKRYRVAEPKIIYEAFDDEVVVLNLEEGVYYSLNEPARLIWNLVTDGVDLLNILRLFEKQYHGDGNEIRNSVAAFVGQLEEEGLIVSEDHSWVENRNPDKTSKEFPPKNPYFKMPAFEKFTDMQELLLLDPIHEVSGDGWPVREPGSNSKQKKKR